MIATRPGLLPTSSPSSWRVAIDLSRLFARRSLADRASWTLPVTALAVVSALTLTVAGGVHWFFGTTGELAGLYRMLASVALVLLLIPLMTLAGAAARLSATRRDTRLSSLRLLGATRTAVRALTLIEAGAMALAGALIGVVGYAALMPLFGLLNFNRQTIGATGLWLGVGPVLIALAGIVVLALVSSAIGLHRVEISPLGVRTRQEAPRMHWIRMAIGGAVLVAAMIVATQLTHIKASEVVLAAIALAAFSAPMLAINLLGPWLLGRIARRDARRARSPVQLLAARSVLENPKQIWRQISGLALVSFVAVFLGVGMALSSSNSSRPDDIVAMHDIRNGVLLTLAISFVTVACSVGLNQVAAILDRRGLYVGLDLIGTPAAVVDAARRRAVLRPLVAVVALAVGSATLILAPLAGNQMTGLTGPLTVLGVLVAGLALIDGVLRATRRTLAGVLRDGLARVE